MECMSVFSVVTDFFRDLSAEVSQIPDRFLGGLRVSWPGDVYHEVHRSVDCLREEEGERHPGCLLVFQSGRRIDPFSLRHPADGSGLHRRLSSQSRHLLPKSLFYLQKEGASHALSLVPIKGEWSGSVSGEIQARARGGAKKERKRREGMEGKRRMGDRRVHPRLRPHPFFKPLGEKFRESRLSEIR